MKSYKITVTSMNISMYYNIKPAGISRYLGGSFKPRYHYRFSIIDFLSLMKICARLSYDFMSAFALPKTEIDT